MRIKKTAKTFTEYLVSSPEEIVQFHNEGSSTPINASRFFFESPPAWSAIENILDKLPSYARVLWVIPENTLPLDSVEIDNLSITQKENVDECRGIVLKSHREYFNECANGYESEEKIEEVHQQVSQAAIPQNCFFVIDQDSRVLGGVMFVDHKPSDSESVKYVGWVWIERAIGGDKRKDVAALISCVIANQNTRKIYGVIYGKNIRSQNLARKLNAVLECIVF